MESKYLLNELDADRATLAGRVTTPWWLPVSFGAIAAAWVSVPAFGDDAPRSFLLIAAIVASIALLGSYRKVTGIKISSVGWFAWMLFGLSLLGLLLMISIAFGLASFGLSVWIIAPAAAAFAIAASLTVAFTTAARERMLRVG